MALTRPSHLYIFPNIRLQCTSLIRTINGVNPLGLKHFSFQFKQGLSITIAERNSNKVLLKGDLTSSVLCLVLKPSFGKCEGLYP